MTDRKILYVGVAGFGGAILRVELGKIIFSMSTNSVFPYPTLLINIIGSFLLAFFLEYANSKTYFSTHLKVAISTGFLGSFTTFSTFSVESIHLLQIGAYPTAIIYIILSFVLGFLFSLLGIKTGKSVSKDYKTGLNKYK